jgi:hypothetical protein
VGPAQLAEQHRYKLAPAGKSSGMAFCFRLSHALFELQTRKKLEKLTENAAESIHGRILLVGVFAFTNLMRWIRPSFQIPNLDKSAWICLSIPSLLAMSYFSFLGQLSERIFLPHRAALEFHRKRDEVIYRVPRDLSESLSKLEEIT